MINVLIADDHVIMRNGLKQVCDSMGDVTVAGEAENGDEVLKAIERQQFDLLILDLTMPGISGIELIKSIRVKQAKLPILVFSMRHELQVAQQALQAGATGFVTKGSGPNILAPAIRMVATGATFIDSAILEKMMFEKQSNAPVQKQRLSERELQIMRLFGQGKSLKEIADELCISSKTVTTHKARLMQKMNLQSNAELVLYATEYGLIEK